MTTTESNLWNRPTVKLPEIKKKESEARCIALCHVEKGSLWTGYLDVEWNPSRGWKRTENKACDFEVVMWKYWEQSFVHEKLIF